MMIARTALDVAEVWCAAAFILAVAFVALFFALEAYADCLTRIVNLIASTAAVSEWARLPENRKKWWKRWADFNLWRWQKPWD
ncbi:MAG: hypothetical protein KGL39_41260 [Patescibacteria group bacterium]|nr:hypothetical protein [Patescibacteria group bacterium]